MVYDFYIDGVLLPITPARIVTKIGNKNKVVTLINGDELNLLKKPKLTEFEFEFLLPADDFPSVKKFIKPVEMLEKLEKLKSDNKPFQFIIIRTPTQPNLSNSMNMSVTLESYIIDEDFKNGSDLIVEVKLKQYISLKTKIAKLGVNKKITTSLQEKKISVERLSVKNLEKVFK